MRYKLFYIFIALVILLTSTSSTADTYERAGWQAPLSTLFHNVSGTVTIEDANTLLIENFNYDGGGPAVYFYLAEENEQTSFINGLSAGPLLTGTVFSDDTFTIDLPAGETMDGYNAISVWCKDFNANFGSGTFGSVVQYQVTFQGTWSAQTHTNFPPNPHFSSLIGGTHDASINLWQLGGFASDGIEAMAELGQTAGLSNEVQEAISDGDAYSVISGGGINPSPGQVLTTFSMHSAHPLVSLVSMIAPSPDWFVGVSDLTLFENGRWLDQVVIELAPYDSGTDSSIDFTSPNADTNPPDPITLITGFPFENDPPLGTFTFQLICPNPPDGDLNGDCRVDLADLSILSGNWMVDCSLAPMYPECL